MSDPRRRGFLRRAGLLCAGAAVLGRAAGAQAIAPRRLVLQHLHTGEHLELVYAEGDRYLPAALARVNRFLRDHYTGESRVMDPGLLDQLHAVQGALGSRGAFQIISGYRCLATNEALRRRSSGVAGNSLHTQGRAVDVRLTGVPLIELRDAALDMRAGGVGFYAASNFVHLDTGRVRRW